MADWRPLDRGAARSLVDARLELHHAAQLATAIGISYLPKRDDDSHTNLEWVESVTALASRPVAGTMPIRLGVRPHPFCLLVLDADANERATFPLSGRTMIDATQWVRGELSARGLDASRYTLAKHYTIPPHAIEDGAPFGGATSAALAEMGHWFANAAAVLGVLAGANAQASEVRCWPHHFDIATLITSAPGHSVGVGMEPGDDSYAEPYFYVNTYPAPPAGATLPALRGHGAWHTSGWVGAVLPASALIESDQRGQVSEFIQSALEAQLSS